jgi:hypothetical protein
MIGSALDTALGMMAGLYRCRGCEDGELLLSWASDFPLDLCCRSTVRCVFARAVAPGRWSRHRRSLRCARGCRKPQPVMRPADPV